MLIFLVGTPGPDDGISKKFDSHVFFCYPSGREARYNSPKEGSAQVMEKKIFPASILEQSSESIFSTAKRLSGVLYMTVLIVIVGVLVAINFIYIDINVQASGVIKPRENHTVITSTTGGFAERCRLVPNTRIEEGDTLLIIRSELIMTKLPALEKRRSELEDLIFDLRNLTTGSPYQVKLKSPMYKQDVLYYIAQWNDADAKRKQKKQAFERNKRLYEANVIPLSEFESVELEYTQAENAVRTLTGYQKRQWQSDLIKYENELRDVETQISQIDIQNSETVIIAPVSGTVQQVQTLFNGSYITAGQQIAEISPDGDLIAECYIKPKDIGYMKSGMKGKIQVSAFNYNEWGMLQTTVDEIFDDVSVSEDGKQSFYRIYCALDADYLTLKNGYKGYVKKGMAVNSNFIVTRRTVYQLLYDKVDKWLNPNLNPEEENE